MEAATHLRVNVEGVDVFYREAGPARAPVLREHRPAALIVWGPRDGYMPAGAARAYLRDLPKAELHLIQDAGHWLLETHLTQAAALMRDFLGRVHAR